MPGVCYRMTCLHGQWCTSIFASGACKASGRGSTGRCMRRSASKAGRDPQPSAAVADSQSVKTTPVGGPRGYDGWKQINGRKRHLLVDTQGLIMRAVVHPADLSDREEGKLLLATLRGQLLWFHENGHRDKGAKEVLRNNIYILVG